MKNDKQSKLRPMELIDTHRKSTAGKIRKVDFRAKDLLWSAQAQGADCQKSQAGAERAESECSGEALAARCSKAFLVVEFNSQRERDEIKPRLQAYSRYL